MKSHKSPKHEPTTVAATLDERVASLVPDIGYYVATNVVVGLFLCVAGSMLWAGFSDGSPLAISEVLVTSNTPFGVSLLGHLPGAISVLAALFGIPALIYGALLTTRNWKLAGGLVILLGLFGVIQVLGLFSMAFMPTSGIDRFQQVLALCWLGYFIPITVWAAYILGDIHKLTKQS